MGVGGGGDDQFWMGGFAGAQGDSGSALVTCESERATFDGRGAAGVLTHLGLHVCPCKVNFKKRTLEAQQGVIFGTTVPRSVEMARERACRCRSYSLETPEVGVLPGAVRFGTAPGRFVKRVPRG